MHVVAAPARPLLKWAGGKRQLLPALAAYYPARFDRYVEPFLGSGAVFFDLLAQGRLNGKRVTLADVNPDLIGCYRTLRDRPAQVITALAALAAEHRSSGATCYYDVRDRRFNPERAEPFAEGAQGRERLAADYPPDLAAMLIFLNRTGFNGLFRLNRSGAFNVPAGRYAEPRICDPEHLRTVAAAFGRSGVTLELSGFEAVLADAGTGDFVYCDPPYAPLSRTASFANYTADGFSAGDQARLCAAVAGACARGATVVLSNSSAPEIVELYSSDRARHAGLRVHRVPARRMINSRATARGPVDELIVTNSRPSLAALRPRMLPALPARRRKSA
jgi:DNA adenine methylase